MDNLDKYYMDICEVVSTRSKCLSRQIGAIAVKNNRILTTGYNGPPMKYPHCGRVDDNGKVWCPRKYNGFGSGQGLEFCPAEHAERNVVNNAALNGVSLDGATIYMNCPISCRECAKAIVNSGIKEVVVRDYEIYPEPGITGLHILEKCGITVRKACLE